MDAMLAMDPPSASSSPSDPSRGWVDPTDMLSWMDPMEGDIRPDPPSSLVRLK